MKKIALVLVAVFLMAAGCNSQTTVNTTPDSTQGSANNTTPTSNSASDSATNPAMNQGSDAPVKAFTVVGSSFAFAPNTMTVNKGDKVRITFQNSGGSHDFMLDEFNVKTAILASGASETVEFTADKTGQFEYYCSVGTHRQMGMRGTLVVQ